VRAAVCAPRRSAAQARPPQGPRSPPAKLRTARSLDPCSAAHAAYCDAAGVLHYVHVDAAAGGGATPLARFALQTAPPRGAGARDDAPAPPPRPLAAFDFVPGCPGELALAPTGSGRVLYALLPRAPGSGAGVFLLGQLTGAPPLARFAAF
jgi:hypothetical protein